MNGQLGLSDFRVWRDNPRKGQSPDNSGPHNLRQAAEVVCLIYLSLQKNDRAAVRPAVSWDCQNNRPDGDNSVFADQLCLIQRRNRKSVYVYMYAI